VLSREAPGVSAEIVAVRSKVSRQMAFRPLSAVPPLWPLGTKERECADMANRFEARAGTLIYEEALEERQRANRANDG
jgi:hypothetical protein